MSSKRRHEVTRYSASSRDRSAAHAIQDEIRGVVIFVAVIWGLFGLAVILPDRWGFSHWFAVVPRTLPGLIGIPLMPFMHGGFQHLISNTIPLFVLLILLAGSKARSWVIVAILIMTSGSLVWLFGDASGPRNEVVGHVGASGLIFALIGYLVASGILEKRLIPLGVSAIVGLMFGLSTLRGLIPEYGVSWSGHFFGLIAGVGLAYFMTRDASATARVS